MLKPLVEGSEYRARHEVTNLEYRANEKGEGEQTSVIQSISSSSCCKWAKG
jgi:hypothetical protein